jgi:hypothetical protein
MKKPLLKCFDALAGHGRRAAAVAVLLGSYDGEGLDKQSIEEVAAIISDELRAIRECAEEIQKEVLP